jgi:hypothetical protein
MAVIVLDASERHPGDRGDGDSDIRGSVSHDPFVTPYAGKPASSGDLIGMARLREHFGVKPAFASNK